MDTGSHITSHKMKLLLSTGQDRLHSKSDSMIPDAVTSFLYTLSLTFHIATTTTSTSTSGSTSSSTSGSSTSSTSENAGTSGAQSTTGVQASTTGELTTPTEDDASSAVSVAVNVALFCTLLLLSF